MTDDHGVSTLTVQIPADGYDISVEVHAEAIKRELARHEENPTQEYVEDGPRVLDLSRFATVDAEPTDEKWSELLDSHE